MASGREFCHLVAGFGRSRTSQAGLVAALLLGATDAQAQRPVLPPLVFPADSGTITRPFVATNGVVFQTIQTDVTNGGEAAYEFTIVSAGDYLIRATVNASNDLANSFYVNVDAEPEAAMIWDIPLTPGFSDQVVSWRGNGTAGQPQFAPKLFRLEPGAHRLILRGREPKTLVSMLAVSPAYPKLELSVQTGNVILLNCAGQINHTYDVLATEDLRTWTVIRTLTADDRGSFALLDFEAGAFPRRFYRLREVPQ